MDAFGRIDAMPVLIRNEVNNQLRRDEFVGLDDHARFIIRRLVADAYARGFDDGWIAGQLDANTDLAIGESAGPPDHENRSE